MRSSGGVVVTAPFPYFGGKRRVSDVVWRAFGADINNFVEPFAGSLATLLGRPGGAGKIETVNDRCRYLANFWRAVTAEPDVVAQWADWPVNEADLHARHKWLVDQEAFRERMHVDPDFYDVKVAGYWVWGICCWIGGGWCVEPNNRKHPKLDGIGKGVHSDGAHPKSRNSRARSRPKLDGNHVGMGVHSDTAHQRKIFAGDTRRGVHSDQAHQKLQIPRLSVTDGAAGASGVHSKRAVSTWNNRVHLNRRPDLTNPHGVHLPSLGNDRGLNGVAAVPCVDWFRDLQARLRRVRVACGDWRRVLGPSVLGKGKNVGGRRPCAVFLDPPYSHEFRDPGLYSEDDAAISEQVREWALEHGDDPELRIALCGYEGEHAMPDSWHVHAWKAARGYAGVDNDNRSLERIWFSPHCLALEGAAQQDLFDLDAP